MNTLDMTLRLEPDEAQQLRRALSVASRKLAANGLAAEMTLTRAVASRLRRPIARVLAGILTWALGLVLLAITWPSLVGGVFGVALVASGLAVLWKSQAQADGLVVVYLRPDEEQEVHTALMHGLTAAKLAPENIEVMAAVILQIETAMAKTPFRPDDQ